MPAAPLNAVLNFKVNRVPPLGKTCDSCYQARKWAVTATSPDGHRVTNNYCDDCCPARTRQTIANA